MTADRPELIRARLLEKLAPCEVEVRDDSHLHAGHIGAREGGGHYSVRIVAEQFRGLPPLARHRLIYAALNEMMTGPIHALSITALTPTEATSRLAAKFAAAQPSPADPHRSEDEIMEDAIAEIAEARRERHRGGR